MCLAIPGKVIKIEGRKLTVEYPGESREVLNSGEKLAIGDFVMVQMGIAVKKVSPKEAAVSIKAWEKF